MSRLLLSSMSRRSVQPNRISVPDLSGEDAFFDQFVIAVQGAMSQPRIFLRRDSSISADDSGWLLASVENPEELADETRLESIAIASLVQRRPALLQALTLPRGFIVVFSGDSIEQIFDAGGRLRVPEG